MLHQYNINGAIRDFIGFDQCGIRVYRKDGKMIGYLGSYCTSSRILGLQAA